MLYNHYLYNLLIPIIFRRLIAVKNEHKDSECYGFWCQLLLSLFGITFLFTGIIMADLWPQIFDDIMKNVIFNFK